MEFGATMPLFYIGICAIGLTPLIAGAFIAKLARTAGGRSRAKIAVLAGIALGLYFVFQFLTPIPDAFRWWYPVVLLYFGFGIGSSAVILAATIVWGMPPEPRSREQPPSPPGETKAGPLQ